MKLWDNIRNYFYKKNLVERLRTIKAGRRVINLDDTRSVGILYDSTNPANDSIVASFAEGLRAQGKTVDILGFVNDKKIDQKPGITVFNSKSLSWARYPKSEAADKFAENNFDLLLCCFTGESLPLEYIARLSRARWRVGAYNEKKTDCYDMMLNVGEKNDLMYWFQQASYFLNQIKYDSK